MECKEFLCLGLTQGDCDAYCIDDCNGCEYYKDCKSCEYYEYSWDLDEGYFNEYHYCTTYDCDLIFLDE